MKYEIIPKPFIFMETLDLLYKHINGILFSSLLNPESESNDSPVRQIVRQRLAILQQIMDEVCQNVDADDPKLRQYFEHVDIDQEHSSSYLARFLISAFMDYKNPGFDETVRDILEEWETMNAKGAWLQRDMGASLQYTCEPGCPGDLFAQICALEYLPAEFRLRLYGALHQFPETMKELTELMRPVALRLEAAIEKAALPMDEMAEYWLNANVTPLEFLASALGEDAVVGAGNHTRLAIALMNANQIYYAMENEPGRYREYNYMYIGCCIFVHSMLKKYDVALGEISAILRGLSERKRLEILRRLSKRSFYGLELAEVMNMDRGNLSRLLTVLHHQGFLRQEKENNRIYYRSDREAMQSFFDRVMAEIFDN